MDQILGEAARLDAELNAALDSAQWLGDPSLNQALVQGFVSQHEGTEYDRDVELDDGSVNNDVDGDESLLHGEGSSILDVSEGGGDSIRVFVRVRPANQREGSERCRETVVVDSAANTVQLLVEPPRVFAFDGVLGEASTQDEVFRLVGTSVGEACLNGYNGSVYVYGQTGSGKTYTMQGPVSSVQAMCFDERRGIMCHMLDLIFSQANARHNEGNGVEYRCKCSYLEIYKEQITDLLEPGSTNLQVREDINRGVYVERLSEHTVWTLSDALHALWKGIHHRHVGATQMNELSSRSHAVFTLVMEATSTAAGGVTSTRTARLNLVDLAGSERQQSLDQPGAGPRSSSSLRVKEAGAINKSLSALTNVIMSLSRAGQRRKSLGGQRRPFVRYRDSKLTFLLRDSLGGNSKTVMVACVSPAALCFGETLSTLKFAARAKHIKCTAVMNEEYSGTVESLMLEVKSLKAQLELLSSRGLLPGVERCASQASWAPDIGRGSVAQLRSPLGTTQEDDEDPLSQLDGLTKVDIEDVRRIYGPRRVRRLEILLATALERERRCELKKHKLDKFAQYLNGLLERKENYFDALRDYFTLLVDQTLTANCLPLEVNKKLIAFRQQLCSVPSDGRAVSTEAALEGALGARISASVGDLSERSLQRSLPGSDMSTPRSRSFGILTGEGMVHAARRQPCGTAPSAGAAMMALAAGDAPHAVAEGWTDQASSAVPGEEDLSRLRLENRLLRRQLEQHPELHRLAVENRLLRQHLASLVQERAFVGDEPQKGANAAERQGPSKRSDGWKGRGAKDQRQAGDEEPTDRGMLPRTRSLTRTSRSSILGLPSEGPDAEPSSSAAKGSRPSTSHLEGAPIAVAAANFLEQSKANMGRQSKLSMRPFPGCEDATQISPSSSSGDSGAEQSDQEVGPPYAGLQGRRLHSARPTSTVDATSFLPTMAREVEELLRVKSGLEENIAQLLQPNMGAALAGGGHESLASLPSSPQRGGNSLQTPVVEVESRLAAEFLHRANEAMSFAEGILAKGKGETLLLSAGGPRHETDSSDDATTVRATAEGLDERDVFLSLMRSLPAEATSLSRQGAASSAPHLSNLGTAVLPKSMPVSERHTASATAVLRPSSSVGSASTRLLRNRSTVQLHRIVESPFSPRGGSPGGGGADSSTLSDESHDSRSLNRGLGQKGLDQQPVPTTSGAMLNEAMSKMKQLYSQLELVSDAYRDVREQFKPLLEEYQRKQDECRFLESQCRRLDTQGCLLEEQADALEATRSKLNQDSGGKYPYGVGMRFIAQSQGSHSSVGSAGGILHSPEVSPLHAASPGPGPSLASPLLLPGTLLPETHGAGSPARRSAAVTESVPPRGLLYAHSVTELHLETQRTPTNALSSVSGPAAFPRHEEFIRRVASAPQLPVLPAGGWSLGTPSMHGNVAGGPASASCHSASTGACAPQSARAHPIAPSPLAPQQGACPAMSDATFSSSTFLSLARQPGAKTAALQYLLASTSSALGGVAEATTSEPGKPMANGPSAASSARTPSAGPATAPTLGVVGTYGGATPVPSSSVVSVVGSSSASQPLHRSGSGKSGSQGSVVGRSAVGGRLASTSTQPCAEADAMLSSRRRFAGTTSTPSASGVPRGGSDARRTR